MSCNLGFYFNEYKCYQCHKNCRTCQKGGDNNNENCLTCNNNYYLIDAEGFGNNCVQNCPEETELDKSKEKCILKPDNSTIKTVLIILFVLLGIIIIFLIFVCIKRYINKRNYKNNIFDNVNTADLLFEEKKL